MSVEVSDEVLEQAFGECMYDLLESGYTMDKINDWINSGKEIPKDLLEIAKGIIDSINFHTD